LSLPVDEECLVELDYIGVVIAVGVAGALAADDDVLRHERSPWRIGGRIIFAGSGERKMFRRSKLERGKVQPFAN
jgi:hypothetical protein